MSPDEYCRRKAARSGSSRYYSLLLLPPEQRRRMQALYAFCREVGEVVEQCSDIGVARRKLEWWREEVARCFAGNPQHPVTRALQVPVHDLNLPLEYFQEILDGQDMDLDQPRRESFNELALYCHRVSGVVALLAAEICGYRHRDTLRHAEQLGSAFQLTRILREVRTDARRGRLYLPLDELERFGVNPLDLANGIDSDAARRLFAFQAQRIRQQYQQALARLPAGDRHAQRSHLVLAALYQAWLDEVEADGYRLLQHRLALTPLRKLWIAWKTVRREARATPR
ncbi:MAG TPA: squalene synthase HpnD [Gammaproteobacteria bacterium]|nr:squalene synthase HpnD [Gammaproteobacteria bacterium]